MWYEIQIQLIIFHFLLVTCDDDNCMDCSGYFQNCTQCQEGYSVGTKGQCISNKLKNLTVVCKW